MDVTQKLSKVDTTDNLSVELAKKIDKPASATDGQVLTYNGTSGVWEAQNSQGGSITEPTDLEKGIIGGDEYSPTETYGIDAGLKNICIYNNKIYSAIKNSFSNVLPTDIDYWEETSISEVTSKLATLCEPIKIEDYFSSVPSLKTFDAVLILKKILVINILTNEINSGWTEPYFSSVKSQYAPKSQIIYAGIDYSGGSNSSVSIGTNGQIKIYNGSGKTSTVGALIIYQI